MRQFVKYLHVGENQMFPLKECIAVLNIEENILPDTLDLVEKAQAQQTFFASPAGMKAKSLVIGTNGVYESPISSTTLYKRAMNQSWEEKNESTGKQL